MILFPAIDIKDGACVRLFQGDYAQVTTYDRDPVRVAERWQEAGASWLHVVDLDGAAQGQPVITELVRRMRQTTTLQIEVGGGMRSLEHIARTLDLGVERVILGTVVLTDRALLEAALARWGERIAVGLDARDGYVAISGWRETSQVRATELATELAILGVQRFIYTDIARDGGLRGPNLSALREMQQASQSALIASGGVSSLADLRDLDKLGVEGAIIGKAIYTGDVDLAQAIVEIEKGAG
ncbi:1-(5-phosphoribosyl)-5-[(5-phosphoribosylamino)methylideneamino]imidazole-4-carboxamide isomerase [Ktedonospora formicarum]|uniref:1-(5-phosphoribosyl)-5-[(5-phosphoribosylamino)methylideneamino] imidazole-4-carboxamide isomerase n=1 Tax=Ktedonospora formicarum TaxID=2778364 RepID=A0A8J3MQK3_9CHLR|nr:1-(5-phosphoribosyl)-5-[(5-phosphoribosylamino)methylideneamino]imidazole-4-carboxamide isomerase [Ktedonospora formicarum]GHO42866.1 1-(5-phosphoribosyl)-5-[(5-phosphoribosylamino) methylideneamino] imidazole-4-carboxamide isomerase [Ktedonospora formicarum]